jgi:archaeal flagellar protein FlaI
MNLIISHGRTFLTAGPRGSGKTSLLGSLILEILQRYRIITIEDTQELPVEDYKKLGYDILPLKVRSALADSGMEMPFEKGLRTSLRLGDSALVVGEVRSVEAKVLYEAMRVGAMSNVVAGTIHADTPYGVYDRVVNDLGVPKGSFKSTDVIIIQNLIKDPSGIGRKRRVIQVTEVLKEWEDVPVFQDLFIYNPRTDDLEPTDFLLKGKSVTIKNILARTQGYKTYEDIIEDMNLRAWAKKVHVTVVGKNEHLLEAHGVSFQNNLYTRLLKELDPFASKENKKKFCDEYERQLAKGLDNLNKKE